MSTRWLAGSRTCSDVNGGFIQVQACGRSTWKPLLMKDSRTSSTLMLAGGDGGDTCAPAAPPNAEAMTTADAAATIRMARDLLSMKLSRIAERFMSVPPSHG